MGRLIGIDLGTTNCCMAVLENNRAKVIPLQDGGRTMPSVVGFGEDGATMVGRPAARQAALNPKGTVYGAKRLIGRKFDDPRIRRWQQLVHYPIVAADNGDAWVEIGGERKSPEEISALLLKELKQQAEVYLGEEVSAAAITVPAYFNERQRQATRDAGKIAGLEVEHILNEPTAAALAFGASQREDALLAVFDLGGGTFDITILEKRGSLFEVRATHGDTFLGGEDFDQLIVDFMTAHFLRQTRYDLLTNAGAMQRVKEAAEEAKRALSATESVTITLPFIAEWGKEPLHLELKSFGRVQLEMLGAELLARLQEPCYQALKDARVEPTQVDRVLLAGGMTRMPVVQGKVEEIFQRRAEHSINPDEIVAIGAAAQCGILTGDLEGVTLFDVTPHSLGVKVLKDEMRVLIPKNATVPTSEEKSFTTTYDYQDDVRIEVYQGESKRTADNTRLGEFVLSGLPRRKRGQLEIVVTFLLDADGLLEVTACDKESGAEVKVEIAPSGGLSNKQVQDLRQAQQD